MGQIYCIRNKTNCKCYVGQTTRTFHQRYAGGRWWKKTKNKALIDAYNKYGGDSFQIIILEENINDIHELNIKENVWAVIFNSYSPNGYNLSGCGNNKFMTEESKERSRKKSKTKIKINCSNGKTYDSIVVASRELGISQSEIRGVMSGKCEHAKGLTFSKYPKIPQPYIKKMIYCSNGKTYDNMSSAARDIGCTPSEVWRSFKKNSFALGTYAFGYDGFENLPIKKNSQGITRRVICSNGKIYNSVLDAAKELGIKQGHISECALGKRRHVKEYGFSYDLEKIPNGRPVDWVAPNKARAVTCSNGKIYKSIAEASVLTGVSYYSILRMCDSKNKTKNPNELDFRYA